MTALFAVELIFAHHFKLGVNLGRIFIQSLQFNQERLKLSEPLFTSDYIELDLPQLVYDRVFVHCRVAARVLPEKFKRAANPAGS
ncbi:hypothetical protein [Bradyrhizobium sp. 27S5]|uniref:hypothetical protein n=1 Tax=Bradyrhizobium sp. 27S5 TaxID=3139728 RepID=UPI0030CD78E5